MVPYIERLPVVRNCTCSCVRIIYRQSFRPKDSKAGAVIFRETWKRSTGKKFFASVCGILSNNYCRRIRRMFEFQQTTQPPARLAIIPPKVCLANLFSLFPIPFFCFLSVCDSLWRFFSSSFCIQEQGLYLYLFFILFVFLHWFS
jgi:hypothetical protein